MNQALRNNPLLAQLKAAMIDSKVRVTGTVLGSRKSYGFLLDEQGNRHFIAPPSMGKLLPGDKVEVVIETENGREHAVAERVIDSSLVEFYGMVRKRKGHAWIEPESPFLNSWMQLSGAESLEEGDWVHAALVNHPFANGKATAKVNQFVAHGDEKALPWKLAMHRHSIARDPEFIEIVFDESKAYSDLSAMNFVTIDSESTMDVDDALYAETTENGFKLWVAIADPTACIAVGSVLDDEAKRRGITTYLPGETHSMLPRELSEKRVSLLEGHGRRTLVCSMEIDRAGDVSNVNFCMAIMTSRAKLSYNSVEQYLNGENNLNRDESIRAVVKSLADCAELLREVRRMDAVLGNFGDDVRFSVQAHELNSFQKVPRNVAHFLVEECMIVGNRAFAAFAQEKGIPCVYRTQAGFSKAKRHEVIEILNHWGLLEEGESPDDMKVFVRIAQALTLPEYFVASTLLRGLMEKGVYSLDPLPHMGMGVPLYATFTSPIRKYCDLINHRMMKAYLCNEAGTAPALEDVLHLDLCTERATKASREVEKHLYARYFEANNERAHDGVVMGVTTGGLRVEDKETGAYIFLPMKAFATREQEVLIGAFGSELWVDGQLQYRIGDPIRFGISLIDHVSGNIDGSPLISG